MKKRFVTIFIVVAMMFALSGCNYSTVESVNSKNESNNSMFVTIESTSMWTIVYHRDTKVMYAVSYGGYNVGTFTLLVDENGDPMLWDK